MLKLIQQFIFFLLFIAPIDIAYSQNDSLKNDILSPINRLKFGNYLFCEDDYLRAIDEFNAYLNNYENDTVRFKIAYGYFNMGKYSIAESIFNELFSSTALGDESRLGYYQSLFFDKDYKVLRNCFDDKMNLPGQFFGKIDRLYYLSYLFDNEELPDTNSFLNAFENKYRDDILKFYLRKLNPPYKNTVTAALLSTIIPGLGKIYTENYGDGITAFLGIGLLTFLAYDNFKADHEFRAWLFSGLAAVFYAGNIYGSAASAQIYNAGINFNFENDLEIYLGSQNYFQPTFDFLCK